MMGGTRKVTSREQKESEALQYFFISLLGLMYVAGETLQYMEIGPIFLRWHLSDLGFPFVFAVWLGFLFKCSPVCGLVAGGLFASAFELLQFANGNGDPLDLVMFATSVILGLVIVKLVRK
jgi:hypothetical protein